MLPTRKPTSAKAFDQPGGSAVWAAQQRASLGDQELKQCALTIVQKEMGRVRGRRKEELNMVNRKEPNWGTLSYNFLTRKGRGFSMSRLREKSEERVGN